MGNRKVLGLIKIALISLVSLPQIVRAQNSSGMPAGNIGIGTTNPSNLLQVHNVNLPANSIGATSEIANFSGISPHYAQFKFVLRRHTLDGAWENVGARLQFVTDVVNQGYLEFNPPNDPYGISLGSPNGEIIRLKNNGNVGIGTSSPMYKLQVDGSRISITHAGEARFHLYNEGSVAEWLAGQKGNANHNFTISTSVNSNETDVVSVTPSGNVGIATTTPLERFQIGDRFTFQDGGWKGICYNGAWNAGFGNNARIVPGPFAAMYFTGDGNIIFQNAPNDAAGSSLAGARHSMVIHNSGQVGIGTNYSILGFSDLNYKLFVEGGIRARKVKVDQSSWPDYVFDSAYNLRPLRDIETFIALNKHLPDVPAANEIERDGLELGEGQAVLLRKIEELTLYLILQEKNLQEQKDRLATQESMLKEMADRMAALQKQIDTIKQGESQRK